MMSLQEMAEFIKIDTSGCHGNSGMSKKQAGPVDRIQRTEKNRWPNIWPGLCMYILMKRDMSARLFLLCQICGFMCNYKSINNQRSRRSKTIIYAHCAFSSLSDHCGSQHQTPRLIWWLSTKPSIQQTINISPLTQFLKLVLTTLVSLNLKYGASSAQSLTLILTGLFFLFFSFTCGASSVSHATPSFTASTWARTVTRTVRKTTRYLKTPKSMDRLIK